MRVAILHNDVSSEASPAERDVLVQVEAVRQALIRLGHEPVDVPVTLDLGRLVRHLERLRPEAAFNLVESLLGSDRLSFMPAAVLDAMGIRYTGSPTEAILVSGDKPAAKARLVEAGLPTPQWLPLADVRSNPIHRVRSRPEIAGDIMNAVATKGTFIIKPVWEHASLGMDGGSVVDADDSAVLARQLGERIARTGCPCFAERFVEGREFNLSLLASPEGPQVLPPAEIDFSAFAEGQPRIVGYRAKWSEESFEFHHTPRKFEFEPSEQPLLDRLCELAGACWDLFGLRGYVRVDFRVDTAGQPWILEINANPCLSPDAGFAAAVDRAGIGFDRAIERILDDALAGNRKT